MDLGYVETVIAFAGVMLTLSVLATAIVQMIAMVLNLRSIVLQWGLTQLVARFLHAGAPADRAKQSKELSLAIMQHPSVRTGSSFWGRPDAIRLAEFTRALGDIAKDEKHAAAVPELVEQLVGEQRSKELEEFREKAKAQIAALPEDLRERVESTFSEIDSKAKAFQAKAAEWFDTVMDRTTEKFASYTRWITLVVAIFLAVFLRVDSIAVFKRLSTDPELRAQVIDQSAKADQFHGTVQEIAENAGTLASDALKKVAAWLRDSLPEADRAKHDELVKTIPENKGAFSDGIAWIREKISENDWDAWETPYRTEFERLVQGYFKTMQAGVDELASLPVFGNENASWWGMILTAIFLSLGAPFWFNALRSLSSLRPSLAKKVEAEGEAAKAKSKT